MKANRIPTAQRIQRRIDALQSRLPGTEPIGRGNPYYCCSDCGRSEPDISNNGHFHGCSYPGILKEIAHYAALLQEAQSDRLTERDRILNAG